MALNDEMATIAGAATALRDRDVSAAELLGQVLDRLHATEPVVRAYAHVDEDGARAAAARADEALAHGEPLGPLHGIPVAVKDVIAVADMPLEAGSRALAGRVADHDAEVVSRLRRGGAVIVGKTITHELAFGQNTPPTRNAYDPEREPGGSSAGSAVATAVGSALAAIGTDGGGSVRHPAALNGVVGLKPTYGLIDTAGVLAMGPSLEHLGTFTRTVEDCALFLSAIAPCPAPAWRNDLAGARLGVLRSFVEASDRDVQEAFAAASGLLRDLGAELVDVDIPEIELAVPVGLALVLPESADAFGQVPRADSSRLEPGTRALLAAGGLVTAGDYLVARRARPVVQAAVRGAFQDHRLDGLICPSAPAPAGPAESEEPAMKRLARPLRLHMWANVTGMPSVSVPCGRSADGLPLGIQLAAAPFAESRLLAIAAAFERAARSGLAS